MKFALSYAFAAILAVGCCHALTIDWESLLAPHVAQQPEPSTFNNNFNRPAPPTRPKEAVIVVEIDHKKEIKPQPSPAMQNIHFEVINSKPVEPRPFGAEQFEIFYQQQHPLPSIHEGKRPHHNQQEPEPLPFFMGGPLQVNHQPKEELQEPETLPFIVHYPKPQPKPVEEIDLEFSVHPAKPVDMINGIVVPSPKYPTRPHHEIDIVINEVH